MIYEKKNEQNKLTHDNHENKQTNDNLHTNHILFILLPNKLYIVLNVQWENAKKQKEDTSNANAFSFNV